MIVDNFWNTDDYNYCKEHDQYYKQYCLGCRCSLDDVQNIKKEEISKDKKRCIE